MCWGLKRPTPCLHLGQGGHSGNGPRPRRRQPRGGASEAGRIIQVFAGEGGAIWRPAHAELVAEIAGDLDDLGLDENLRSGLVEFLHEFDDLWEEVQIGGDEE